MCDSKTFRSHSTNKEYQINFSFDCDSSDVVYLIECRVFGVQYVGSTCTPFRNEFNNYIYIYIYTHTFGALCFLYTYF